MRKLGYWAVGLVVAGSALMAVGLAGCKDNMQNKPHSTPQPAHSYPAASEFPGS